MTAETVPGAEHVDRLLPALLNGTLTPGERVEALQHLDRCAACRTELAAWAAIRAATRTFGDLPLTAAAARSPGLSRRLATPLSKEPGMDALAANPISPALPLDRPRFPARPGRGDRGVWPLAHLATAALLALTLTAGFVAARMPHGPSPEPAARLAVPAGAPGTPPAAETGSGIAPLMQAEVDRMPMNPTIVWVVRTVYQPGAGDVPGAAGGPNLAYVERGEVAVAADAPVLTGKPPDASGAVAAPRPASNPHLGPGGWFVVPSGVSYAIRNVGLGTADVLTAGVVSDYDVLSGSDNAPGTSGTLLGTLTGNDMPPAPVTIAVGRTTLDPGASLPAVPTDSDRLVVPDRADGGVGMSTDGSARNLTDAPLVVDVVTIAPAGTAATPAGT
jgi:hypothetical protein